MTIPLTPPPSRLSSPVHLTPTKRRIHANAPFTPPYTPESVSDEIKFHRLSVESTSSWVSDDHAADSARPLSDNELSYFLPSRADGVNDMYLHHRLTAPNGLMDKERILHLWALQLLRQPLLASQIAFKSYEDVSFVHSHHTSLESALSSAEDRFVYIGPENKDVDIIDSYLNGPRSLSPQRLALLVVADKGEGSYDVMLCATHFLGDGMALHTFMNEFYILLGSSQTTSSFATTISAEFHTSTGLPLSLEDRMPVVGNGSSLAKAVGKAENAHNDSKLIGGQAFPTSKTKKQRHTIVPTFAYSPSETKTILSRCKANGSTIAHAMFALCNIAWARKVEREKRTDPCLIYSALNLRPNMLPAPSSSDITAATSYFHLAVGYFNIVLPSLLPSGLSSSEIFWHRARETKKQTVKAVKSPFVVSRSRATNKVRRDRAVKWAKIDDEEAAAKQAQNAGLGLGIQEPKRAVPVPQTPSEAPGPKLAPVRAEIGTPATPKSPATETKPSVLPPASQRALMGVSMLGNLDGMYKHAAFGDIVLTSLTTGSRQRPGGLLLFAYTFAGKLWMSLGYDQNGFEEGAIEGFWQEVQDVAREVLL